MSSPVPVICVDGPNASGKGSLSGLLARRFGWHLLDSGALYRLVALRARRAEVDLEAPQALATLASELEARFEAAEPGEPARVLLGVEDVSLALRTEQCGADASVVAVHPAVRQALLARQRAFRQVPGLVADGRDMGTVVFPDAPVKIFLTASPRVRAARRYKQLSGKGIDVNLAALSVEIAERDRRDREREASPLRPASDAVEIDTSDLSIDVVLERIMVLAQQRGIVPRS